MTDSKVLYHWSPKEALAQTREKKNCRKSLLKLLPRALYHKTFYRRNCFYTLVSQSICHCQSLSHLSVIYKKDWILLKGQAASLAYKYQTVDNLSSLPQCGIKQDGKGLWYWQRDQISQSVCPWQVGASWSCVYKTNKITFLSMTKKVL